MFCSGAGSMTGPACRSPARRTGLITKASTHVTGATECVTRASAGRPAELWCDKFSHDTGLQEAMFSCGNVSKAWGPPNLHAGHLCRPEHLPGGTLRRRGDGACLWIGESQILEGLVREWHPDYIANDLCWAEDDGMHTLQRTTSRGEDELKSAAAQYGGITAFDYPRRTLYPG